MSGLRFLSAEFGVPPGIQLDPTAPIETGRCQDVVVQAEPE